MHNLATKVVFITKKEMFFRLRVCVCLVYLWHSSNASKKSGIIAVRVYTGTALASTHQIGLCRCKRFLKTNYTTQNGDK